MPIEIFLSKVAKRFASHLHGCVYVLATTPGDAHVVNTKKAPLEPSTQWKSSPRINSNAPLKVVVSLELIVKYTEIY